MAECFRAVSDNLKNSLWDNWSRNGSNVLFMGLRRFSRGPLFALEELLRSSKNYLRKVSLLVAVHDGGTPDVPARVAKQRHENTMTRKLFQLLTLLNNWLMSLHSSHNCNQENAPLGTVVLDVWINKHLQSCVVWHVFQNFGCVVKKCAHELCTYTYFSPQRFMITSSDFTEQTNKTTVCVSFG